MDTTAIKQALQSALANCEVELTAEGSNLNLVIVSDDFAGLSRVKRQQKVYSLLNDRIASGEIHAVSMRTLTRDE